MLAPDRTAMDSLQFEDKYYAALRRDAEALRAARREVRRLLQELRDDVRAAPLFEMEAIKRMLMVYAKEKRSRSLEAEHLKLIKGKF